MNNEISQADLELSEKMLVVSKLIKQSFDLNYNLAKKMLELEGRIKNLEEVRNIGYPLPEDVGLN